ncbi:hypothetical protein [Companilactobacillus nuruki]|uniref:Uncharacterized protein n=1 Tax=Companilactobacillus nuruki TaxID=1993540 RepID=A0A2N7AR28_9LACO|nr:hypothetical protein [Companilactobacillus nuruki]PMD67807.1 hypothetical protein CBP76_12840 [Companilactobacillus nuruki]
MADATNELTKEYDADKIDDILSELDDSKIKIDALMDYNLQLRRSNDQQINKNILAYEFARLSPIMELLNNDVFESLDRVAKVLSTDK